jgi:hypothetical protein
VIFLDWLILHDSRAARACFAFSLPVLMPIALALKTVDRFFR